MIIVDGVADSGLALIRNVFAAATRWSIDADSSHPSHPPSVLPRMIQAAATADLVIGSRWVRGGRVQN